MIERDIKVLEVGSRAEATAKAQVLLSADDAVIVLDILLSLTTCVAEEVDVIPDIRPA